MTHAVCVGMTGSGKTGLCPALIEEAAIDGLPAPLIDPTSPRTTTPAGRPSYGRRGSRSGARTLRRRLDAGPPGGRQPGRAVHWRNLCPAGHRPGPTHDLRAGDDVQARRLPARRSRRDQTLKYRPTSPLRFGSIQDARSHCRVFFPWYNTEHHHTGLGLLTPYDVHHGLAEQRLATRATVLTAAYAAHPERFTAGMPRPPAQPGEVWINPPKILAPLQTSSAILPLLLAHAGAFV